VPAPQPTRISVRFLRRFWDRHLNRGRAVWLALVLTCLSAAGDVVTTAQTAFTLFYLFPLAIAVWFVDLRMGYVIAGLSVAAGVMVDVYASPTRASWGFIAWNNGVEGVLFIVVARLIAALRTRIGEEIKRRNEALDQLRHSDRLTTVGKLAAGIAHEIGTPLNVISGHAQMIASGELSPDDVQNSARIMRSQVDRITGVVRQLLDFSRRGGREPRSVELGRLIDDTIALFAPVAKKRGVTIVRAGGALEATLNRSEIQQVLANLIANAMHAMPDGGSIVIEISAVDSVDPEQPQLGKRACAKLSVRDQGTGIDPSVLPYIFDPFFTTKEAGEGTGLGLSVSYGIVKDHGGWISVDSTPGEGTSFHVFIPHTFERGAAKRESAN
jgi:signal transduction histidine kinase